ncbi:SDR family oxidoreductase [Kitasatospora purpeofusca]|uniref:SDR family NAD(P)-dependent oxidoreductase n=1 Tax=Kitasatospora purpeofusca TaxID=67352 RepID=UPI0033CD9DBE
MSGVAVVSGGSRGLGQFLVERLLSEGWQVATFSRTATEFITETTEKHPDTFHWKAVDLADSEALRGFVREAAKRFGRIDALINNAGSLQHDQLLVTMRGQEIEQTIAVNLTAPVVLAQACARAMIKNGSGNIINVSSVNSVRGYRGVAAYSAAKSGLDGFTRSLARELGPFGIRVNTIVPGFFESDMTQAVTEDNQERIKRRTPLGRIGSMVDVSNLVFFALSEKSAFVTGQRIIVDGGITC